MAILNQNDVLFAHKALNIMPGLSEATRRVAAAIIDHFNKRDGRCYPSIERLAKLLGIDRATVIRATDKLHGLNFIRKVSHGGKSHCASYSPNWDAFRAQVEEWDTRMKAGDQSGKVAAASVSPSDVPVPNVASVRRSKSQGCDVKGRSGATQTLRSNQSNEPIEREQAETPPESTPAQSPQTAQIWLRKEGRRPPQRSVLPTMWGGHTASRDQAARAAAERRWYGWVQKLDQGAHARLIEWMTEERREAATQAEMSRRDGGMDFIVKALQRDVMQRTMMLPQLGAAGHA